MSEVLVEVGGRSAVPSSCAAPFTSLYLDARGNVRACCINSTHPLGNIRHDRLLDLWHAPRLVELRRALAGGNYDLGCELCRPPSGLAVHPTAPARSFDPLAATAGPWPRRLELALSNTCNLQCEMCFGELSSSIRIHREGLPPLPKVYDDRFFEDLDAFLPHVAELEFLGGEPLLSAEAWRIWDRLDELDLRPACHVTTNGTVVNRRVEWLLDRFPVSFTVSVDGATRETFERIRRGARFDRVLANLDHLATRAPVRMAFCLSTQSWWELPDVLLLGEGRGIEVNVNLVTEPARLSLWRAPVEVLEGVAEAWTHCDAKLERLLDVNLQAWRDNLAWARGAAADARSERGHPVSEGRSVTPLEHARTLAAAHAAGGPVLEVHVDEVDRIIEIDGVEAFAPVGLALPVAELRGRPFIALLSGPVVDRFGASFTSHLEDRHHRTVRLHEMTFAESPGTSVQVVSVAASGADAGTSWLTIRDSALTRHDSPQVAVP